MIRPDVILSFGGYLAVPVVIAGWFLGIPSVTHEQTVVVGYANKVIARFAKRILISWKESAVYFPGNKTVLTGIPLRKAIFDVKSTAFEARNSLPTIYITAGKTGAHIINEIIIKTLPELLKFCNVIHQSGDYSVFNDYDRLTEVYKRLETKNSESGTYFLRKFVLEDEIGEAFNKASLVVSRSGAHTVCELLALKKPALLIPIPWVSHNEQNENAKLLKKYGLAEILAEENLTPATFIVNVKKMLTDLKRYGLNASTDNLIHEDAAKLIVSEVVNVAKK
jgi:UDP-N-acetylglucosamine--N-acetylmuramyl-(pentapeptide) pyrophosphoryl-undecaprenol N-acetylglucosamine transferase